MLTILVILFILLYLVQNISHKKEKDWRQTQLPIAEKAGNLQMLSQHIKRIEGREKKFSYNPNVEEETEVYRQLLIKYEQGLINKREFANEVSLILTSINEEKIKQTA